MEITHDVYYTEWLDTPMPEGITIVEDISSPAGAMVTVRGTYTAVCAFVMWLYDECDTDGTIDALPSTPGDELPDDYWWTVSQQSGASTA